MSDGLFVESTSLWRDILLRQDEIDCKDFIAEHAPAYIRENLERGANRPWLRNADGLYYRDTRVPILVADNAAVTLSTTALDLWLVAQFSTLPANYWTPGKTIKMTAFGKITTVLTPGNLVASLSSNAAVNTSLVSSAAIALTASQTNLSWRMEGYITCRSIGTAGTMQMHGHFFANNAVVASTSNPILIPASAPTTVTQDTTVASAARMEVSRSGSTAETMQTTALYIEALN